MQINFVKRREDERNTLRNFIEPPDRPLPFRADAAEYVYGWDDVPWERF